MATITSGMDIMDTIIQVGEDMEAGIITTTTGIDMEPDTIIVSFQLMSILKFDIIYCFRWMVLNGQQLY